MSTNSEAKPAELAVAQANEAVLRRLPFDDTGDLADARRGFMGTAGEAVIRSSDGAAVWDLDAYG
ncbi:hypothetical protein ACWDZX_08065 [Streptomyces collinus]